MVATVDESTIPVGGGVPPISAYILDTATGKWKAIAGVDQGDGTAALKVVGAGITPTATSIKLQDGTTSQLAQVTPTGALVVHVDNPSTGGGSGGHLDYTTDSVTAVVTSLPAGLATDTTVGGVTTSLGTDGATPPTIPGTGVRGWLRSIYDRLTAGLDVTDRSARLLGHVTVDSSPHLAYGSDSVTVVPGATFTVGGTVAVSSSTLPTGAATEQTVKSRFGVSLGSPTLVTTTAATDVYIPATGKSPRVKWLYLATPDTNTASTVATVKIGTTYTVYTIPLGVPGIFAHGSVREGAVNDHVTVQLSVAQPCYVNIDAEDF